MLVILGVCSTSTVYIYYSSFPEHYNIRNKYQGVWGFLKAFSKHLLINKVKKSYTYVCNKKFKDNFKMPLLFNSCKSQLDYPINMTQHDTKRHNTTRHKMTRHNTTQKDTKIEYKFFNN